MPSVVYHNFDDWTPNSNLFCNQVLSEHLAFVLIDRKSVEPGQRIKKVREFVDMVHGRQFFWRVPNSGMFVKCKLLGTLSGYPTHCLEIVHS